MKGNEQNSKSQVHVDQLANDETANEMQMKILTWVTSSD